VLSQFDYPKHYSNWQQQGLELEVASTRLGLQPLLAGLKTLNRLEQVLIKQEISDNQWQDAVVLDLNGHVIESSMANLIAVKDQQFYTPSLQNSGIQGVYLQHLTSKHPISVCTIKLQQLLAMDAVFCCNSLMGLIPVTRIQHRYFDLELAKQLKEKLEPSA
jgi:4-amino-4-deoxychorismate lyase